MHTGLLTTHKIVVTLFFLHYVLKLALLLFNKSDVLAKYTKATRIPEMILSLGFLVTGVWLFVDGSALTTFMIIKLGCVVASIPLAIVGFRKQNKALASLAVFLIVAAYGLAEMSHKQKGAGKVDTSTVTEPVVAGKIVYKDKCVSCHGDDGKANLNGAKDLSISTLSDEEKKTLIRNGKNAMPPFQDLTDDQVNGLIQYVATLKR